MFRFSTKTTDLEESPSPYPLPQESHHGGSATRKLMKIATPRFVAGLTGVIPAFREGIFEVGKGEGLLLKSVFWSKSEKLNLVSPTDSLEDPKQEASGVKGPTAIPDGGQGSVTQNPQAAPPACQINQAVGQHDIAGGRVSPARARGSRI